MSRRTPKPKTCVWIEGDPSIFQHAGTGGLGATGPRAIRCFRDTKKAGRKIRADRYEKYLHDTLVTNLGLNVQIKKSEG